MKKTLIKGNAWYIRGGTNTGIIDLSDKEVLIVDPGLSTARGRRMAQVLQEEDIIPSHCVATHEHLDHYEAFTGLLEAFPDCLFFCPKESVAFLEIPELFYTYAYGGKPHKKFFGNTTLEVFDFCIHKTLTEGEVSLSGRKLTILNLKGHSHGMAGILSEDGVLFLGDSLFDYPIMKKNDFPFIFDVDNFLHSLQKIKQTDFDLGLIAHSRQPYPKREIDKIADKNKENVYKYLDTIQKILTQRRTREDILREIIEKEGFEFGFKEYQYYYSTVGSMLSYLYDKDQLDFEVEKGLLYYYNR